MPLHQALAGTLAHKYGAHYQRYQSISYISSLELLDFPNEIANFYYPMLKYWEEHLNLIAPTCMR